MSVSGISAVFGNQIQRLHDRMQQFRQDFQQLGQDLQAGNLSAAQSDFAALQQLTPQNKSTQNSNPVAQDLNQLSQDLAAGDLSAAQQAYATLQQDLPQFPQTRAATQPASAPASGNFSVNA
jgi:outer membrane protein assembly factor BamD (BamD/ComL family)